jgi:hypothetical protein
MSFCEINDIRDVKEFKGMTFSNFKKTDVQKELLNNLEKGKIEPACYWASELICSNHFTDLWETIILFYSKYIHLANPKGAIYLDLRIDNFKEIVNNGYVNSEIRLRNNLKIRNLFCEIIYILCVSNRKHKYDVVKLCKSDYDMGTTTERFKAQTAEFAKVIFLNEDPTELFVAVNELAYNLSDEGKNIVLACYWIEWLIEFDCIKKNKKEVCKCERRNYKVDSKFQNNVIWIIWDLFFHVVTNKHKIVFKTLNSILNIFTFKYTPTVNKKRRYLVYFVVSLLCDSILITDHILKDDKKDKLNNVLSNVDLIYQQIKKSEISPQTEYLFKDVKKHNLESTIKKLETLNSFENTFIPRI